MRPVALLLRQRQVAGRQHAGLGLVHRHVGGRAAAVPVIQLLQFDAQVLHHGQQRFLVGAAQPFQRTTGEVGVFHAQDPFLASVASSIRAMSPCCLIFSVASEKPPGLQQVEPHPPVAHRREGVRLQEQLHDQQHLGDAAVLLDHLAELARQHRDREALRINPLVDGPLLELIHDVGDADLARAFHRAGVAGGAQPDGVALEDLVLEVAAGQRHDLARRVIHVDAQRANARAGAALDAALQLLAARHAHDLLAEAFDPVRVVLNRALYFHHKLLRRTGLPARLLPGSRRLFRHHQRRSVEQ